MLRSIEQLFLQILVFFHQYTGNYGWDIILLTLLIRLILFPITMISIRSMKGMQALQPRIKEIQAKYKGSQDPKSKEKMNLELMKIYKEGGVNPMLGCLPMLLQLPVFIALYQVLRDPYANGFLLVNSNFFGMDLSTAAFNRLSPEFLGSLNLCLPGMVNLTPLGIGFFHNTYLYLPTIVLVAFFLVTMFFQQKSMQMDPNQAGTMMMMNVMFAFIGFTIPSGVLLYWDISNLIQIVQQKFTGSLTPAAPAKGAAKDSKPSPATSAAAGKSASNASKPRPKSQKSSSPQPQKKNQSGKSKSKKKKRKR